MVKWTPEKDQLLLLKILETHDLSVDTKSVAEAWPTADGEEKPTSRAISERLVRMRKQVKASGVAEGHFSIGKGAGATPTEARTPKNSGPAATPKTPGSRKRKSGQTGSAKKSAADADAVDADADYDAYVDIDTPSKKPRGQSVVKAEHEDVGDSQKRVRGQSQRPEMMVDHPSDPEAPGLDDDEFDLENSGSGYVPDNSIDSGKEIKIEG